MYHMADSVELCILGYRSARLRALQLSAGFCGRKWVQTSHQQREVLVLILQEFARPMSAGAYGQGQFAAGLLSQWHRFWASSDPAGERRWPPLAPDWPQLGTAAQVPPDCWQTAPLLQSGTHADLPSRYALGYGADSDRCMPANLCNDCTASHCFCCRQMFALMADIKCNKAMQLCTCKIPMETMLVQVERLLL